MKPRLVVAGCGYVGAELALQAVVAGWEVEGWSRSVPGDSACGAQRVPGLARRAVDLTDPKAVAAAIDRFRPSAIVHCASSGRGGPEAYRRVFLEGTRNLQAAAPEARLVFTGSTSVYAQTDGSEVDEESPVQPDRETGRILLETEALVLGAGGVVARLAGIYGPGRCVHLRKLQSGEARLEDGGDRWINQIHRDDAASALLFLTGPGVSPGIYNVCDDCPLTQRALYRLLATRIGCPLPPEGPRDTGRKRGWTHKRVMNRRLRALGWTPRFASFEEALVAGAV